MKSITTILLTLALSVLVMNCTGTSKQKTESDVMPYTLPQQEIAVTKQQTPPKVDSSKTTTAKKSPTPEPKTFELADVKRSHYLGININPDSLHIRTEYDYYPISTKEINLIIVNNSNREYTCGECYSIEYYDKKKGVWEPLSVNPISNSLLWIISPKQYSCLLQTISLYTEKVPNRPGKYRISKPFNDEKEVAMTEFEMVDQKGVDRYLMGKINKYLSRKDINDTISENWITIDSRGGDSIYVNLKNNSLPYREQFRREVLNYSALNFGIKRKPQQFETLTVSDTMDVSMMTEKDVYPVRTVFIPVIIRNNSNRELFFGEEYTVARKDGDKWILLNTNSVVNSLGIGIRKGGEHRFHASMYNLVNDNKPGTYKVIKKLGFDGSRDEWYMSAKFRLE